MGSIFWFKRFMLVFSVAFLLIAMAQLLKGRALDYSLELAALWAAISSLVFVVFRIHQSRKGVHCALCNDLPGDRETT